MIELVHVYMHELTRCQKTLIDRFHQIVKPIERLNFVVGIFQVCYRKCHLQKLSFERYDYKWIHGIHSIAPTCLQLKKRENGTRGNRGKHRGECEHGEWGSKHTQDGKQ